MKKEIQWRCFIKTKYNNVVGLPKVVRDYRKMAAEMMVTRILPRRQKYRIITIGFNAYGNWEMCLLNSGNIFL